MEKKKIRLCVYFDNNLSEEIVEIEYENEQEFQDKAEQELDYFYNSLIENCIDSYWEEIND